MIRLFLGISVLAWAGYGTYCFIDPVSLAVQAGVTAGSTTGTIELRAMYGGVQIGIGVLALLALLRPALQPGVLLTLAVITGSLFSARLMAVLITTDFSAYTVGALVFECVYTVIAAVLARRAAAA